MSGFELAGVVQLDRSGEPPRVLLDTHPVQRLDVRWDDIVGCWRVRLRLDEGARRFAYAQSAELVVDMLVVRYRGPFFRVPGYDDAFWPGAEAYGFGVESLAAVAQRDERKARTQIQMELGNRAELGNLGTKSRRKGHKR